MDDEKEDQMDGGRSGRLEGKERTEGTELDLMGGGRGGRLLVIPSRHLRAILPPLKTRSGA